MTIEQSIEDTYSLITHIKTDHFFSGINNAPVIILGSSLGGTLAVLLRQKYPGLSIASFSLNPILLVREDYSSWRDYEVAKKILLIDPSCK